MSRRTRLLPEHCGLPFAGRRRRTPGLRREEVSALAGISTAYYTWIEQGRMFDVSIEILTAIAAALRLNEIEAAHLFTLAGKATPQAPVAGDEAARLGTILQFVLFFDQGPAVALAPWLDVIGFNTAARDLLGIERGANLAVTLLSDGAAPAAWRSDAAGGALTALLRRNYARDVDNEQFRRVIETLRVRSTAFASLWDVHVVDAPPLFDIELEQAGTGASSYRSVIVSDPVSAHQFGLFMSRAGSGNRA